MRCPPAGTAKPYGASKRMCPAKFNLPATAIVRGLGRTIRALVSLGIQAEDLCAVVPPGVVTGELDRRHKMDVTSIGVLAGHEVAAVRSQRLGVSTKVDCPYLLRRLHDDNGCSARG